MQAPYPNVLRTCLRRNNSMPTLSIAVPPLRTLPLRITQIPHIRQLPIRITLRMGNNRCPHSNHTLDITRQVTQTVTSRVGRLSREVDPGDRSPTIFLVLSTRLRIVTLLRNAILIKDDVDIVVLYVEVRIHVMMLFIRIRYDKCCDTIR